MLDMEKDEIDVFLSEFGMVEYVCSLLDYLNGMITGCPVWPEDAKFFLSERYFPDHPVMDIVKELRHYDY
jgi:hypothetical protein